MNAAQTVLRAHDLDLLLREVSEPGGEERLRKLGLPLDRAVLTQMRDRAVAQMDPRWTNHYERARRRYGRAVAGVRGRVCLGCFMSLPTSATPSAEESLTVCESCARILYWR